MKTIEIIDISRIKSRWYNNILSDWKPDREYVEFLKKSIKEDHYIPPVIVTKEGHDYCIVNGHHRLYALMELGKEKIKCIVISGTFEDSEPLRKAELLLKEFDKNTDFRYRFSGHLDRWAASLENQNYINISGIFLIHAIVMDK